MAGKRVRAVAGVGRFSALVIATTVVLVLAALSAADLGFIALAATVADIHPSIGVFGDFGAVLSYFTFYPSVFVAAITLVVGALVNWRAPQLHRRGVAIVVCGILSAAFVALALLPHAPR
jgi:hypothetical protein